MSIIAIVDAILIFGLLDDRMRYVRFLLTKTQKTIKIWEIFKKISHGSFSFIWGHLLPLEASSNYMKGLHKVLELLTR